MKSFEIEYVLSVSPTVVYDRLCTPSGLSEWFADDVNQKEDVFTFFWEGSEQQAQLLSKKKNEHVRFHWLDSDKEESFFEFKIEVDDLTKDLSLLITDWAYEDEIEESVELWDTQVDNLKHVLGI
ncbi:MAG: hypothetical protein CSB01_03275 [Bacteroidia bacterium]|nr:MAG: hypothetical protein CSB01_03275 [Bacteroidia bacterium]